MSCLAGSFGLLMARSPLFSARRVAWYLSGSCVASHGRACSLSFSHPPRRSSHACPPSVMILASLARMCRASCGLEQIPALSLGACYWYVVGLKG